MAARTRAQKDNLKVVHTGDVVGPGTRIYYVRHTQDGFGEWQAEEIDISHTVTAVGLDLRVGALSRCTLETICARVETEAHLESVLERYFRPKRLLRLRSWWIRHPRLDRLFDVTTVGQHMRLWKRDAAA